jgi:hypothetical protein
LLPNALKFDPETIAIALFNQLQTANGTGTQENGAAQFNFQSTDRRGQVPENMPGANQPYLGLVQLGFSQVENQAQGIEKWLLHFRVLVYIRADASPEAIPATQLNAALLAIVNAMRSVPYGERQTLGGLVDNAWIEGDVLQDTGIIDQQMALMIPIIVDVGL